MTTDDNTSAVSDLWARAHELDDLHREWPYTLTGDEIDTFADWICSTRTAPVPVWERLQGWVRPTDLRSWATTRARLSIARRSGSRAVFLHLAAVPNVWQTFLNTPAGHDAWHDHVTRVRDDLVELDRACCLECSGVI